MPPTCVPSATSVGPRRPSACGPRLEKRTVLVLSHHGPYGPQRRFTWRESGLVDARRLVDVLRDRRVVLHHGHSHHRYWHRATGGAPHVFGGGSATDRGTEGFWLVELDDHQRLDARRVTDSTARLR